MENPLTARIAEQHAATVHALSAHLPGAARRRAAMEALAATGLPGSRRGTRAGGGAASRSSARAASVVTRAGPAAGASERAGANTPSTNT